ncbi:taste receptor type 2 member 8-like [Fukomys damarensis]|uniref:taste receptor type 2 member 8-like n=1 Tax=Fukomys damarensis TaxID=885580 RepID=UPI0014553AD4|nr:taste receptor type 2 member 8-like [Fukomys damarensis]
MRETATIPIHVDSIELSSILETLPWIILIVKFIMGIWGNGFIALINGIDWVRNRKISLIDFILTCLASSRICFLRTTILIISFNSVHENLSPSKGILMSVVIIWMGSNYFCTAFATCLTLFYFFKIANFSNPIFLWMKQRMLMVLLVIVLGTALSCCMSLIFIDAFTNSSTENWMKRNLTFDYMKTFYNCLIYLILLNMAFIIFFVVSLTSFLLLIFSLWSHTKRMKLQGLYSRDSSTEAHLRAMKAMISSLLLFIMFYISHVMIYLDHFFADNVSKIFVNVLVFFYPSVHPYLLILWNNKLEQASLYVLRKLKCIREEIISYSQE